MPGCGSVTSLLNSWSGMCGIMKNNPSPKIWLKFSSNVTIHGVMARAVTKTGFSSYLVCIPQQHVTNRRSISNASCVCNLDYAKWMQTITQAHFLLFAFSCLSFLFKPRRFVLLTSSFPVTVSPSGCEAHPAAAIISSLSFCFFATTATPLMKYVQRPERICNHVLAYSYQKTSGEKVRK